MPQNLIRFFLLLCLGLVVTLPFTPRAHASWVSHWLGMDHHTSATATATATATIKTETTPLSVALVIIQAPASPIQTITPKLTELPVTGPLNSVLLLILASILSVAAISYSLWRQGLRNRIRAIDIL